MPVTIDAWRITGQSQIDSYVGRWVDLAVLLVDTFAASHAQGRPTPSADPLTALHAALADPEAGVTPRRTLEMRDAERLADVARALRPAFGDGPVAGVQELNELLVRHGAVPNLHGDPGAPPVLAFHRADADLVDAWAADVATALAMVIGVGQGARLGSCQAAACDLVYFDTTRNASRRFCGLACQNRAKAAAYRARRRP